MSTKELAIINQGPDRYEFSSGFDGVRYILTFSYNRRNDTWYLNIEDGNKTRILTGLVVLTNSQDISGRFVLDDFLVGGEFLISDINANGDDPSFLNFGDTVSAFYLSVLT